MNPMTLEELDTKFEKLNNYLINIYKLLTSYIQELQNNVESKDLLNIISNYLNDNKFDKYNKLSKNISIKTIDFYLNLLNKKYEIEKLIKLVNKVNIYDEKTLLSDTSKNIINSNKIAILQLNSKIENKYNTFIQNFIIYYISNFDFNEEEYIKITEYYNKHTIIINLYIEILRNYLNKIDLSEQLKTKIIYNNKQFQNNIITKELEKLDIKYNINNLNDLSYLFKSNIHNIKVNNIIDKFSQYHINKSYNNFEILFSDIFSYNNIKNKISNNKIDNNLLKYINQILIDYYKIEKKHIVIILIESEYDDINYNLVNLLNEDYKLEQNQGVNTFYINKTKTIVKKDEISKLLEIDSKYKNDIYINNIQKINIINNYKVTNKLSQQEKEKLLFDTDFLIIYNNHKNKDKYNKDDNIHIMTNKLNNNIFMSFLDVELLLQNKVDYSIENYKDLLENIVLQNIEKNNMLELYNIKVTNDYSNLPKIDNLELKNLILNKIKKTKLKDETKEINRTYNIDLVIELIIEEIYNYIIKKNNIDFSSEIYLTYYSNINSFINKIKKEMHNQKDNNILSNIDNILDNIYSNIITINNNILDKSYLIKL